MYSPKQYWEKRGTNYPSEPIVLKYYNMGVEELSTFLEEIKPQSLIEVGCGFGCLFKSYSHVPRVLGIDLSSSMICHAISHINSLKLGNIEVKVMDARNLNSLAESFDVVVSRYALMHIPPSDITLVTDGMKKVCKKYIFIIEYSGLENGLANHCFRHSYVKLFLPMELKKIKLLELRPSTSLYIFEV